jgi:hypothetical protein
MKITIFSVGYLFLRLAPFIIVSFFSLASFFNQDFKGIIYLAGLLGTCFMTVMFGNMLGYEGINANSNSNCSTIEIGDTGEFSKLPLGQTVYGFTYVYLMYIITRNGYVLNNIPTIVFFPLISLFDMSWNISNTCYDASQLMISLAIGSLFGLAWSYIIDSSGVTKLQYFNGISGNDVCERPSKTTFRCKLYKNGKLISENMAA